MKKKVQVVICLYAESKEPQVLLFKTNERRGYFWQNITGSVEKNEDFIEGAIREVYEESGIKVAKKGLIDLNFEFKFQSQWGDEVIEKCFLVKLNHEPQIKIDSSEHCEYKWVEFNKMNESKVKYPTNWQAIQKAMAC
jgi:dATP pyrophosphohydrolase